MTITVTDCDYRRKLIGQSPVSAITGRLFRINESCVDADFWSKVADGGGNIVMGSYSGDTRFPIFVLQCNKTLEKLDVFYYVANYSIDDREAAIFTLLNKEASQPLEDAAFGQQAAFIGYRAAYFAGKSGADVSGNSGSTLGPSFPTNVTRFIYNAGTITTKFNPQTWTGFSSNTRYIVTESPSGHEFSLRYNHFSSFRTWELKYRAAFGNTIYAKTNSTYASDSDFDVEHILQAAWQNSSGVNMCVQRGSFSSAPRVTNGSTNSWTDTSSTSVGESSQDFDYEFFLVNKVKLDTDELQLEQANLYSPGDFYTLEAPDNPSGANPVDERFGTLSVVSVALSDLLGTKNVFGTLNAQALALTTVLGTKSASAQFSSTTVAAVEYSGTKSTGGTLYATAVGVNHSEGYKSAQGTLPVTSVALAGMPGVKQAYGSLSVTAVVTASFDGSALDIRYGSLAVSALALSSVSGTKQNTGTLSPSAIARAYVNAIKTTAGALTSSGAALPALCGYKYSFGTLGASGLAQATILGYSNSTPTYFTSYRIEGVLQSVTIQAVLESTTLQGEI